LAPGPAQPPSRTGSRTSSTWAGRLSDMSARTGIAVRSLARLEQAFKDSGLGAEAVGRSVARMQDSLSAAARGEPQASRAFAGLRLNAVSLLKLQPDEQFAAVGKAIASIQDPALRTAAAMDVFGRSGSELLALFRGPTRSAWPRSGSAAWPTSWSAGRRSSTRLRRIGRLKVKARDFSAVSPT